MPTAGHDRVRDLRSRPEDKIPLSHTFLDPEFDPGKPALTGPEAHHAVRVLRFATGDSIRVTNGAGTIWEASIIQTGKDCLLEVISASQQPKETELHLAVGITQSSDRMEWMVEKLTELGATHITMLALQRCERKKVNIDRLRLVAAAALKQSGRAWLPEIMWPLTLQHFIQENLPEHRFVGYLPDGNAPELSAIASAQTPAVVLIGPEGDLTLEEFQVARDHGFQPVQLGKHVLRTETAAVAACCLLRLGIQP